MSEVELALGDAVANAPSQASFPRQATVTMYFEKAQVQGREGKAAQEAELPPCPGMEECTDAAIAKWADRAWRDGVPTEAVGREGAGRSHEQPDGEAGVLAETLTLHELYAGRAPPSLASQELAWAGCMSARMARMTRGRVRHGRRCTGDAATPVASDT